MLKDIAILSVSCAQVSGLPVLKAACPGVGMASVEKRVLRCRGYHCWKLHVHVLVLPVLNVAWSVVGAANVENRVFRWRCCACWELKHCRVILRYIYLAFKTSVFIFCWIIKVCGNKIIFVLTCFDFFVNVFVMLTMRLLLVTIVFEKYNRNWDDMEIYNVIEIYKCKIDILLSIYFTFRKYI